MLWHDWVWRRKCKCQPQFKSLRIRKRYWTNRISHRPYLRRQGPKSEGRLVPHNSRHDSLRPPPVIGHFQLHRKWGPFQPHIQHTMYTITEVKEQLTTQWSSPVNDSSASDKLLVKLTRASNILNEIVKITRKDAQEKWQRRNSSDPRDRRTLEQCCVASIERMERPMRMVTKWGLLPQPTISSYLPKIVWP